MNLVVENGSLFRIEHCRSCAIPGYLIVTPHESESSLSRLSPAVLQGLGPVISRATSLIETVVKPLNVYCAKFGEEDRRVHFHLFPRTAWLSSIYRNKCSQSATIHGPLLLDWARETFRELDDVNIPPPSVADVVAQMRAIVNGKKEACK